MPPARPLRIPSESEIRRAFERWSCPPPVLRNFMLNIAPVVDEEFITSTIALAVVHIASMRPDRKIKHLDILLDEVNFPWEVAEEINRVIDLVELPPEFYRAANRLVPPLENLTGAMRRPRDPVPRQAYQEAMTSFGTLRDSFVKEIAFGFLSHTVAHETHQGHGMQRAVSQTTKRIRYLDNAAAICDFTLRSSFWQRLRVTPVQVVTLLNAAKARDDVVQQLVDDNAPISDARYVLSILDDLIIDHCERAINAGSQQLQPFAFWEEALTNAPHGP